MSDKITGNKLPKWGSRESTPGIRIDSGPHLGIIKNNSDPARLGRLQVWIPDLGGDGGDPANGNDPSNWFTVSYASPYMGATIGAPADEDATYYGAEQQTYGFWAIPPDVNNFVLVTFVMGDPTRGYWFACIPNTPVMHMTPAIARPVNPTVTIVDEKSNPTLKQRVNPATEFVPVTELNTNNKQRDTDPNFVTAPKLAHLYQTEVVLQHGLESDPVRGTITSSAQRDTPSYVFGISTPGRLVPDPADFPNLDDALKKGDLSIAALQRIGVRQGGHSFVMDDGDLKGNSKLVRLRTAGGHTILMHDTEDVFYIINKTGTAWVELTKNGSINVYSDEDLNIRSKRDINFHADANVNIHSGDTIKMYAEKKILAQTEICNITSARDFQLNSGNVGVLSDTAISFKSTTGNWLTSSDIILKGRKIYLNTKAPAPPGKNKDFEFYQQPTVEYDTTKRKWIPSTEKFDSINSFTPTHEPWKRTTGNLKLASGKVIAGTPQTPPKTTK